MHLLPFLIIGETIEDLLDLGVDLIDVLDSWIEFSPAFIPGIEIGGVFVEGRDAAPVIEPRIVILINDRFLHLPHLAQYRSLLLSAAALPAIIILFLIRTPKIIAKTNNVLGICVESETVLLQSVHCEGFFEGCGVGISVPEFPRGVFLFLLEQIEVFAVPERVVA